MEVNYSRDYIERECTRLLVRSLRLFDDRDWLAYARLFSNDGTLIRSNFPDQPVKGPSAIEAALRSRPVTRVTRHHLSNIEIELVDDCTTVVRSYAIVATANIPDSASIDDAPPEGWNADSPFKSGEYHDRYIFDGNVWRIAHRVGRILIKSTV